jgi:hypothetical protein
MAACFIAFTCFDLQSFSNLRPSNSAAFCCEFYCAFVITWKLSAHPSTSTFWAGYESIASDRNEHSDHNERLLRCGSNFYLQLLNFVGIFYSLKYFMQWLTWEGVVMKFGFSRSVVSSTKKTKGNF